jgi:CHRD domain
LAPLGTNAGAATVVPAFPGFPLFATSGMHQSRVFDLTQPAIYNPPFITLEGGLAQAEAALIAGIENGQSYLNIHTMFNPGGEIQGQLLPITELPIPEPATLVLVGSPLVGFVLIRLRRLVAHS